MEKKLIFKEDELVQGSEEWFAWRSNSLGGSEVAALMYATPFKSIRALWEERVGVTKNEFTSNEHTERGNRLEPVARELYSKLIGKGVDVLCYRHPEYDFMHSSLDGITECRTRIVEIKCPSSLTTHTKQTKDDSIPAYRYPQLQHQMAVVSAFYPQLECVDYFSYVEETTEDGGVTQHHKVISIYPDWDYIRELIRRERIFMDYVRTFTEPPDNLFREDEPLVALSKQDKLPCR